jgi:membrane-associated protease RseP (regulator of RpoE activity)
MPLDPQTWFVIGFYAALVLLIIIFRKKFEFQAKFIALLKTKLGLSWMDKIAKKYPKLVRALGYVGIWVGYIGMGVITYFIFYGLYILVTKPAAPATFAPVIPGVKIPGSPVFVPFWHGIIAIFIVAAIHEFCHGVVARAHNIPVKSSGIVFFGPLIGAFVEPDDKVLNKKKPVVQNSMFAAGPFSNIILAVIIFALLSWVFAPATDALVEKQGFYFGEVREGFPAYTAGLKNGTVYTFINNQTINDSAGFIAALEGLKPNDTIIVGNENVTVTIIASASPDDPSKGYIGVWGIYTKYTLKNPDNMIGYAVLDWFTELFVWIFVLTLGIGLANLLPLGALDGGRMFKIALLRKFDKKKTEAIFKAFSLVFIVFLILLLVPIFKAVGQSLIGWLA